MGSFLIPSLHAQWNEGSGLNSEERLLLWPFLRQVPEASWIGNRQASNLRAISSRSLSPVTRTSAVAANAEASTH